MQVLPDPLIFRRDLGFLVLTGYRLWVGTLVGELGLWELSRYFKDATIKTIFLGIQWRRFSRLPVLLRLLWWTASNSVGIKLEWEDEWRAFCELYGLYWWYDGCNPKKCKAKEKFPWNRMNFPIFDCLIVDLNPKGFFCHKYC